MTLFRNFPDLRGSHAVAATVAIAFLLPFPLQAQQGAQPATAALQAQALQSLPFGDRADFEDARRGFIAAVPDATVAGAQGPVWSMKPYAFLQPDTAGTDAAARAPDTVHPSRGGRRSSTPSTACSK